MNKKKKIEEILIELGDILTQFSNEKRDILSGVSEEDKSISQNSTKVLSAFLEQFMEDDARRKDFLSNNKKLIETLQNQNTERERALEKYVLKLYSLYDDLKIEYFENALNQQHIAIEKAKLKDIITVEEFELLYDYSKESQKGFRARLNDPLPYIQKSFGAKIQYRKPDVEAWLKRKNKLS